MGTDDAAIEEVIEEEVKEPLFSKKNRKLLSDPLDDDNPITRMATVGGS